MTIFMSLSYCLRLLVGIITALLSRKRVAYWRNKNQSATLRPLPRNIATWTAQYYAVGVTTSTPSYCSDPVILQRSFWCPLGMWYWIQTLCMCSASCCYGEFSSRLGAIF